MKINRVCNCAIKQIKPLSCKNFKHTSSYIQISEEVEEALVNAKPVVALESTIITHGMPFPHNYETALAVEEIIRRQVNDNSR